MCLFDLVISMKTPKSGSAAAQQLGVWKSTVGENIRGWKPYKTTDDEEIWWRNVPKHLQETSGLKQSTCY